MLLLDSKQQHQRDVMHSEFVPVITYKQLAPIDSYSLTFSSLLTCHVSMKPFP